MKNYFLTLFLFSLLLGSCRYDSSNTNDNEIVSFENDEDENQDNELESVAPQIEEWFLYEGIIGDYYQHVVFLYRLEGDSILGQYYYSKHQKPLQIAGIYDKNSNKYRIQESYKGKRTGYLELSNINGKLKGEWKKSSSATESQQVVLNYLERNETADFPYTFNHEKILDPHEVYVYNGYDEDQETLDVVDELCLTKISDKYYSFAYHVTGGNAHLGSVDGIIKMKNDTIGIFNGEDDCELTFKILPKEVIIEEDQCGYYHGAHAYFDNRLRK